MKKIPLIVPIVLCLVLSLPVFSHQNQRDSLCHKNIATCVINPQAVKFSTIQSSLPEQTKSFFALLFNAESWPPRWQCGVWTPFHGWLYIISDFLIGICYFLIPLILWAFLRKNKQWKSFRLIIILFILFIVACGSTHFIDVAIFWWPAYRVSALLRLITAVASTATVVVLVKVAPKILQLKSPEVLEKLVAERTSELKDLNQRLQLEIEHRIHAEEELAKREKTV